MMSDIDFGAADPDAPEQEPGGLVLEATIVEPEVDTIMTGLPAVVQFPTDIPAQRALAIKAEVDGLLDQAKAISIISDEETYRQAVDLATLSKKSFKRIDELCHYFTAPHTKYNQSVRAFFKIYLDPLQQTDTRLRRLIKAYQVMLDNEQKRKQAEMDRQAAELTAKSEAEAKAAAEQGVHYAPAPIVAPVAPPAPAIARSEHGSVYTKKEWTFELVDINLVEEEFLLPRQVDTKKVREAIRSGGRREIPGFRIFQDINPNIRTS